MLKKPITYETLDGAEVTEDFYFNISQAELAKLNIKYEKGVEDHFQAVIKRGDRDEIVSLFEDFILMSVGKRGDDNKSFIKDGGKVAEQFKETDAYSVLFVSLLQDGGKEFQRFLVGVLPSKLQGRMEAELAKQAADVEETRAFLAEMNTKVVEDAKALTAEVDGAKEGLGEFKLIQRVDGAPKSVSAMEGLDGLDKLESYSREELIGMSEENFKQMMSRYTGGNIPKILLQVALQRM